MTAEVARRRITPEQEQAILALYAEGMTREQVAALTGVSEATVTRVHAAKGLPMRPRGGANYVRLTDVEYQRTAALYEAGYSEPEIAEALGISRSAVNWRLDELGIQKRTIRESLSLRGSQRESVESVLSRFG